MFGLFESKGVKRTLSVVTLLLSRLPELGQYADTLEQAAVLLGTVGVGHPLLLKLIGFLRKLK